MNLTRNQLKFQTKVCFSSYAAVKEGIPIINFEFQVVKMDFGKCPVLLKVFKVRKLLKVFKV